MDNHRGRYLGVTKVDIWTSVGEEGEDRGRPYFVRLTCGRNGSAVKIEVGQVEVVTLLAGHPSYGAPSDLVWEVPDDTPVRLLREADDRVHLIVGQGEDGAADDAGGDDRED